MKILASPAFSNEKANPYNALLYRNMNGAEIFEYSHRRALFEKYDVLHFHWPDGYVNMRGLAKALQRMAILSMVVGAAKCHGAKIVWTVHNLEPHDPHHPKLLQIFLKWFAGRCDGFIFLSEASRHAFRQKFYSEKNKKSAVIFHGHYRDVYHAYPSSPDARSALGLPQDKKVILSLGLIKPYKNIDSLITHFRSLKRMDTVLVIAGACDDSTRTRLLDLIDKDENIYFFPEFVPSDRVGLFMSAADLAVLPFKSILNSGSLLLSLSFNKKVLAPALGSLIELQNRVGEEWIDLYEGPFTKEILDNALNIITPQGNAALCPLDAFEWNVLAQETLSFYKKLL